MTKQNRFLSILLAVCMLASLFTSFASANSQEQAIAEPNAFELPDIIDSAEAEENCYVGRLKDAENDLNTFVFAGSDGTNTMRVYSHPVKYIADDGSVRDISLDIKARLGGGFISADHEIITTFKRKLSDGISLTYK